MAFKGLFEVNDGFFGFLDVHEGLRNHFEVFDGTLGIEDFQVAPRVVVAVLQFIEVDLGLLFLGLYEGAVGRLDFLEHVECFFGVAHLHGKIRLCQHDSHFFRCVGKLTDGSCQDALCLVKDLELTVYANQVKENARAFFLAEGQ